MKINLLALMLICSINTHGQFFYQKMSKTTFIANSKRPVVFKSGAITVTTTAGKVSAKLKGKQFILATPPKNEDVQVTAYDLDGDKIPEIFVAYFDMETNQNVVLSVFDGKSLVKIGKVPTGNYFEFKNKAVIGCVSHQDAIEKHIYYLKKGKFVIDKENSIY